MTTGRPELALGTHGRVHVEKVGRGWRARVRVRDFDGVTRLLQRVSTTRGGAEQALQLAVRDRQHRGRANLIQPDTRFADVARKWFEQLEGISPSTRQLYADRLRINVLPALGKLRMREVSVSVVDQHLIAVRMHNGPASARTCRSVISGICGLAVRHDAMVSNPCRDVARIPSTPQHRPNALSAQEVRDLHAALLTNPKAVRLDLPDLVAFLAATGARIGEACAVSWQDVSSAEGTVHLHGTVLRLRGKGLVVSLPKSPSSNRIVEPPSWCMAMLDSRRSQSSGNAIDPVFPAPTSGTLRDPSNTRTSLRDAFVAAGHVGLTSHAFRRTVATLMDAAGRSAREAADQLGHAQPTMTLNHYMGRKSHATGAADVLEPLDLWNLPSERPSEH